MLHESFSPAPRQQRGSKSDCLMMFQKSAARTQRAVKSGPVIKNKDFPGVKGENEKLHVGEISSVKMGGQERGQCSDYT